MSNLITTSFTQQYRQGIQLLSQQKGSRLRRAVRVESDVEGKTAYFDQIAPTNAVKLTTRHGPTPQVDTQHARRMVTPNDYVWADKIDNADKLRTINDPTSSYQQNAGFAMGRAMDDEVICGMFATSYTGEKGEMAIALPSTQILPAGNSGMVLSKLLSTKEIMDAAENDPEEERFIVCTARQITNLLNTTEVKNADYNTVRALASGTVDTFMGFEFIRIERLSVDGSGNRLCGAWTKNALLLGVWQDFEAKIDQLPTNNYTWQVYCRETIGATRMQENGVVQIPCKES